MEENILKVITPLTAEFVPDRWSGEDEIQDLDGRGLMPYREQIEQTVAEQAVDLLAYYDGPEEVRENLVSILPSVAVQDGRLCGCTAITYRQDLSEHQWNALFREIAGQYSDGWGEGFEQRDIEVDGGILNVHFWQSDGFEMIPIAVSRAEQTVPERPGMELVGHDGNIFAILGRAAKLLRENGQNAASVEMRRRVTHCDNYYKALGIISEYVETELSVPRDLPPDPARRKKKNNMGRGPMSGTLLERLQQKVDAELEQYRAGLLSQGAQAVMDNAYELTVKSELAARVECAFLDRRQLKGLLAQEHPLQYVYDRWEPEHAVIGDLLADTVYAAGREADRECITDQKRKRSQER